MQMSKLDLTKLFKDCYTSRSEPGIVDVPPGSFLTIAGRGAPGGETYQRKLEALYAVAYRLKFLSKHAGNDFAVCKLEALWWFDGSPGATVPPREQWNWKMMIRQPDFVSGEMAVAAVQEAEAKKKLAPALEVSFEHVDEGLSAQIMHHGPYTEEEPTIARLHAFIEDGGHQARGLHHEIYLNDPRRAAPEKLRTIIRQPIQ
jgi:hypothetical protein